MCMKWMDKKIKKMNTIDIAFTKISVFAFAIMVAKLWAPILNLEWYWYGAVFVLAALKPIVKLFS